MFFDQWEIYLRNDSVKQICLLVEAYGCMVEKCESLLLLEGTIFNAQKSHKNDD